MKRVRCHISSGSNTLPLGGQAPLRRSRSLAEHPPNVGEDFPHTPLVHCQHNLRNNALIIFDLDGTLVNAYPAVRSSINHTLKTMGYAPKSAAVIRRSVGWGDKHLLEGFLGKDKVVAALKIYRRHHAGAVKAANGVKFLPGAKTALTELKKDGYRLAIASNRPTKSTLLILKTLNARAYFDMVLCADKAKRPKPYPDMLVGILRALKIGKQDALYVGDMTIDVTTGRRAGIRTVAVATGSCTPAQLKRLKPWRMIDKMDRLKTVIGGPSLRSG